MVTAHTTIRNTAITTITAVIQMALATIVTLTTIRTIIAAITPLIATAHQAFTPPNTHQAMAPIIIMETATVTPATDAGTDTGTTTQAGTTDTTTDTIQRCQVVTVLNTSMAHLPTTSTLT